MTRSTQLPRILRIWAFILNAAMPSAKTFLGAFEGLCCAAQFFAPYSVSLAGRFAAAWLGRGPALREVHQRGEKHERFQLSDSHRSARFRRKERRAGPQSLRRLLRGRAKSDFLHGRFRRSLQ